MFGRSYQENLNSPVPPEVQFYQASERTLDHLLAAGQATQASLMTATSVVPGFNATMTLIAGDVEGAAELYLVDAGAGGDYDLWNNAHSATLADYGLVEGPGVLYHPSLAP